MRYRANLRSLAPQVCAAPHIALCVAREFAAIFVATLFTCTTLTQYVLKTALPLISALALGLSTTPVQAISTSSAFSASSTSIGSSSASVEKSSSSSSTKDKLAKGPYNRVAMTALASQPDMLRLQAVAQTPGTNLANGFVLLLPRQAAERGQLVVGQVVLAEHRLYGIAFATVATTGSANTTPFFLVLEDAWFGELESHPIGV